jgi:hypothetical protein
MIAASLTLGSAVTSATSVRLLRLLLLRGDTLAKAVHSEL